MSVVVDAVLLCFALQSAQLAVTWLRQGFYKRVLVLAHAQGTAPWTMLVLSKHGLGWGGMGC